jgi:hypothetical protein
LLYRSDIQYNRIAAEKKRRRELRVRNREKHIIKEEKAGRQFFFLKQTSLGGISISSQPSDSGACNDSAKSRSDIILVYGCVYLNWLARI